MVNNACWICFRFNGDLRRKEEGFVEEEGGLKGEF